ncbi:MAG: hypothetical protein PHU93_05220, partial [Candidatus Gracilibacteria bacterium]|nr:hypothetical protein [Candidatus Gracilibacteria bacterium]
MSSTLPLTTPLSFPTLSLHFMVIALLPSQVVTVMFLVLVQVSQVFPPVASQAHEIYICIGVELAASVGQVMVSATVVVLVVVGMVKFHPVGGVWSTHAALLVLPTGLVNPAVHAIGEVAPVPLTKLPALAGVHGVFPLTEYVPGEHGVVIVPPPPPPVLTALPPSWVLMILAPKVASDPVEVFISVVTCGRFGISLTP